ncbi:aminodeoxychorismate synthase component I [Clostridium tarantellae]|uniref:Anthranilate synthase component 1 n=1 Tax=Clostridium tarantellae TaxID=39493 RepID=A0A6I1MM73_9CLOT|nr:aminodeoxychorismate synthase component I [Clostridium tarantellae]MPQ44114.1 aminodeoxychorismate synthase component I [Clostridium tarantellae]
MDFKIEEVKTDLNCVEIYSLFSKEKDTILLDSSKEDSEYSSYSFIGLNSFLKFKSKENKIIINEEEKEGDAFEELEKLIKKFSIVYPSTIPLLSGCIGYFSYDIGRQLEVLPNTAINDINIPDSYFIFFDNIIIFDLKNKKTYITALGINENSKSSINKIKRKIHNNSYMKLKDTINYKYENQFFSNFKKEEYLKGVEKVKNYILEGHVYIANLTQRFWCENTEDSFLIYSSLRNINKAPFSCYLNLDDFQVISSSPERFLKVENRKVETRPIKGTRPRGTTKEEDKKNKEDLLNSEKDKSELLMIVDLERNDLSKVCKPNSINVTELFKLEEYSTVFHLVSTIVGELKDECSSVKCMRECFPGGSITGAPKIRAMEIIEELEGIRRGIYTGAIGYFDFRGGCDFNIVIRTILKKDNKAFFGVGGGITIESDENMEYEETLDKAKALMRVL